MVSTSADKEGLQYTERTPLIHRMVLTSANEEEPMCAKKRTILIHQMVVTLEKIKILKTNTISDSKRQQTTTVDNKRLINGFFLTSVILLQHEN